MSMFFAEFDKDNKINNNFETFTFTISKMKF